jgi:hypothetical protein
MPPPRLTLGEAMRRNGIDDADVAYERVAVKPAPSWLRAVWPKGISAMALPKSVYVNPATLARILAGESKELLRHESIHIDQWRRYGRLRFVTKYLIDYLKGRASGLSHADAYRSIPFEREASSRNE